MSSNRAKTDLGKIETQAFGTSQTLSQLQKAMPSAESSQPVSGKEIEPLKPESIQDTFNRLLKDQDNLESLIKNYPNKVTDEQVKLIVTNLNEFVAIQKQEISELSERITTDTENNSQDIVKINELKIRFAASEEKSPAAIKALENMVLAVKLNARELIFSNDDLNGLTTMGTWQTQNGNLTFEGDPTQNKSLGFYIKLNPDMFDETKASNPLKTHTSRDGTVTLTFKNPSEVDTLVESPPSSPRLK